MKTTYKVIIISLAVIVGAWLFYKGAIIALGEDRESVVVNEYQDKMLKAKEAFLEKPDDIQMLALEIKDMTELSIISNSAGEPLLDVEGDVKPLENQLSAEQCELVRKVMSEYTSGGRVYNIRVTARAVLFYTDYSENGGCAGVLYEKQDDSTDYYSYIELVAGNTTEEGEVGRWLIFYNLPNE